MSPSRTPLEPSHDSIGFSPSETAHDGDTGFWLGLIYTGLAGSVAVAVTMTIFTIHTWGRPHRALMSLTLLGFVGLAGLFWLLRHRIVACASRLFIFSCWNIAMFGFITSWCLLDGGFSSPINGLLLLPMFYLGVGFPLPATLTCGIAGLVFTTGMLWLKPGPVVAAQPTLLLNFLTLNIAFMLAVIGAGIRDRKDNTLHGMRLKLEKLASVDTLTGCLNHGAFSAALTSEVERAIRYRRPLSVLLIDIDHFKDINDEYGHLVGDQVLRDMGKILRAAARDADMVGRQGGDELAVLAPETTHDEVAQLAERLQDAIRSGPTDMPIRASIGACTIKTNMTADALYRGADRALYQAKRAGRDRVAFHAPDDSTGTTR